MFFFVVSSSCLALPGQAEQTHTRASSEKTWPPAEKLLNGRQRKRDYRGICKIR